MSFRKGRRRTNGTTAEHAFDNLYQQHYVALLRASVAITLDLEAARDITHEAFARLWERRDRLAPDSNERAWLMRVTVNLAISHRRGLLMRLRHQMPVELAVDPAAVAIRHMENDRMRASLLKLNPRERAVLALRYSRGLSFAEIGEVLQQPEGTVRAASHRALLKLRTHLSGWIEEGTDATSHSELKVKI